MGPSGQTGLSGASERSESESEGGASERAQPESEGSALCQRFEDLGEFGKTGLSGASDRSSSESRKGAFDGGFEAPDEAVILSWACVLVIANKDSLEA